MPSNNVPCGVGVFACAFLLYAFPLTAQTGVTKPASVEGSVTDSVTGVPLPRVHVMLQGSIDGQPGRYGTTTGADGKFSITGIAPGSYSAQGERVGYVMPSGARDRTQIALKADDSKTAIDIKLTPTGAITGRVTDADGEPIEGANVTAQGARSGESSNTDEKGQFRIGGLAPGEYRVKASGNGEMWAGRPEIRTDGTAEVHNAATWYPGALTEKEAGRVEVRPGVESNADLQLVRVPFVRVSGKVTARPRDIKGGYVTAWQAGGGNGTELNLDGSFEIWRLDPGKYLLTAEWQGPDGKDVETAGTEIEVGTSNIDNIELRIVAPSNLSGRLEFQDAQAKQRPAQQSDGPERMVRLFHLGVQSDAAESVSVSVGSDDTFRLEKVPAGSYRVALSWDAAYVKSMRLGSTVIDDAVLDLSNGSVTAELSLLLSAPTGSISGTVRDDQGNAAAALVALEDTHGRAETGAIGFAVREVTAKVDGTYAFTNLAPGTYRIVAIQDADQGNSIFGYEDLMEEVEVRDGEKVTKDLKRRTPEDQ